MKDIKKRYFKDDDSPMYLNPNAERDYRKSKEEYIKNKERYEKFYKEFNAYYNTLMEGRKRLDEIKQIGKK
jgi:hypothetical protein|nr:MAG TPA: hypothetical protein [Ackermannviridae sp.]